MSNYLSDDEEQSVKELREEALAWWQRGYETQMRGEMDRALELYTKSIEIYPTAEAHTFRGWVLSFQGQLDEAIVECGKAIEVDPDYGNPYNDIGAYLIQKGDLYGAIPWLQRALEAKRYECYFYPHYNLGCIYEQHGDLIRAMNCYKAASEANRNYVQAVKAYHRLRAKLN